MKSLFLRSTFTKSLHCALWIVLFASGTLTGTNVLHSAEPESLIPESIKGDSWKATEQNFYDQTIPNDWVLLGPIPDTKFKRYHKETFPPESTDDWKALKTTAGKSFRKEEWKRPDDATDWMVDLAEILDPDTQVIAFAKTTIDWPIDGKAMVWFHTKGRSMGYMNNKKIFDDYPRPNSYHVPIGPKGVLVDLKKGPNTFKVKVGQRTGDWGFAFRVERYDFAYRLQKFQHLLKWFPWDAKSTERGCFTHMKIARLYEQAGKKKEAQAAYKLILTAHSIFYEHVMEAQVALKRLAQKKAPDQKMKQTWKALRGSFNKTMSKGHEELADMILRQFIAEHPFHPYAGEALNMRAFHLYNCGLAKESKRLYLRALNAFPNIHKIQATATQGLLTIKDHRFDKLLFETSTEFQNTVEDAKRQMRTGRPEDVKKAMRSLGYILRSAGETMVRIRTYPNEPKYVGIRTHIQNLLTQLGQAPRALYQETVARISESRYLTAKKLSDPTALEQIVSTYPFTPAAAHALNSAGNIYMDRGNYRQAKAHFNTLLNDYKNSKAANLTLTRVKLIHCQMASGELIAARKQIQELSQAKGAPSLTIRGQSTPVKALIKKLTQKLASVESKHTKNKKATLTTHAGNLKRTGAAIDGPHPIPESIRWIRQLPRSTLNAQTTSVNWPDPNPHLPSYPVATDQHAFFTTLESAAAVNLKSGAIAWQQTWDANRWPRGVKPAGFPISCPTVSEGRLYMRALENQVTTLRCYQATTGKLLWDSLTIPELKNDVFLSDPVIAYGIAVAVYLSPAYLNTHGLVALNAENGKFLWKKPLATGFTGIKVGRSYRQTTLHLGPPAAADGIIYATTGLSSIVAINAFTGEMKWLNAFPRLDMRHATNRSPSVAEIRKARYRKWFSRGPLSPIVTNGTVILSPKDGSGLLAFDQITGELIWRNALNDNFYLLGLCNQHALLVGESLKAVDCKTGQTSWRYSLKNQRLTGRPGFSGGWVYLPLDTGLQLIDARSGKESTSIPWDATSGAFGNLLITNDLIVGSRGGKAVAWGSKAPASETLKLSQARDLELKGQHTKAAALYTSLLASKDPSVQLPAICGQARVLTQTGKNKAIKQLLTPALKGSSTILKGDAGQWQISTQALTEALMLQAGAPIAHSPEKPLSWDGTLSLAWQMTGRKPKMFFPHFKPSGAEQLFVYADGKLKLVSASTTFKLLWEQLVGPGINEFLDGPKVLVIKNKKRLMVLDRFTGERLWDQWIPTEPGGRRTLNHAGHYRHLALGDDTVAVLAGNTIFAFDLASGKLLWTHHKNDRGNERFTIAITIVDDKLVEIKGRKKQKAMYCAFHKRTGKKLPEKVIWKSSGYHPGAFLMPDRKRFVFRPGESNLVMVDLRSGKTLWTLGKLPKIYHEQRPYGLGLALHGPYINMFGGGWKIGNHSLYVDSKSGKLIQLIKDISLRWVKDNSFLHIQNAVLERHDLIKGKNTKVWKHTLPGNYWRHRSMTSYLDKDRLLMLTVRLESDQYRIFSRVLDWATGDLLEEKWLPGGPQNGFNLPIQRRGNLILYAGAEALYAVAPFGHGRAKSLQAELSKPNLTPRMRLDKKRALSELQAPTREALLAPKNIRIDGDLGEWLDASPIHLKNRSDFIPFANTVGTWKGAEDLNVKIFTSWNSTGVYLAIDAADDTITLPKVGPSRTQGDSIRIALNSQTNPHDFRIKDTFICQLARTSTQTVLFVETPKQLPEGVQPVAQTTLHSDGKGLRYEVMIPWKLLRHNSQYRPGRYLDLRLSVAIYDDDGQGVKGAMEWGAGLAAANPAHSTLSNIRMGKISLLALSRDLITRYRKVLTKIPDAPEALRFLDLILAGKRGPKANEERTWELIAFVKANPNCRNTVYALSQLYRLYKTMKKPTPNTLTVQVAKAAKCPPHIISIFTKSYIKVWVNPKAKKPPEMIMLQFNLEKKGWCRRAYWGASRVNWGRAGTSERRYIGPIPPAGTWTELTILPIELNIIDENIIGVAFTTFGGQVYFDRLSVNNGGKETILIDDALPKKNRTRGQRLKFVPEQHKFGTKSWTITQGRIVSNSHVFVAGNRTWFRIHTPNAPKPTTPDPQKLKALYLESAETLPISQDGWTFLKRAMDLIPTNQRLAESITICRDYLKKSPKTVNALSILKHMKTLYSQQGEKDPIGKCEDLMSSCKLPKDTRREFYTPLISAWDRWHVIGPWEAIGARLGLDSHRAPERFVDLSWTDKGLADVSLKWFQIPTPKMKKAAGGYVNLHACFSPKTSKNGRRVEHPSFFGYAYRKLQVPSKRRAFIYFGAEKMLNIWVNGKRVVNEKVPGSNKDVENVKIMLKQGENLILLKVGCPGGRGGFYFRIADDNGRPFADLPSR